MQTDRTTKAMVGIVAFLSLGSLQACMAPQEESSDCSLRSPERCRVQAEAGDAAAQAILGYGYDTGLSVPQGYTEAVRWYLMAA